MPADKQTVGLLGRLHVHALSVTHIGKESNLLEQQEEGILIADPQAVYWGEGDFKAIRSLLNRVPIVKLATLSGVSPEMLRKVRRGERRPSAKTAGAIMDALGWLLDETEG
jgi:hypothetical protein